MENNSSQPLDYIKGVVEALLFVNEKPVTLDQMKKVIQSVTPTELKKAIELLNSDYESRSGGITIQEIAGGYQMLSNPKYVTYVRNFYKTKHKEKLSKPALETLAIIAYKQPVTRADIELIRGVNSDGVVAHLLDKELIKMVGRKDVPGRPFLYGTTKQFLEYFGLKSLDTLPNLQELESLQRDKEDESTDEQIVGVPNEEVAMNTMEQQKQAAIMKAEGEAAQEVEDTQPNQESGIPEQLEEENADIPPNEESSDDQTQELSTMDEATQEFEQVEAVEDADSNDNLEFEPQSATVGADSTDTNPRNDEKDELK